MAFMNEQVKELLDKIVRIDEEIETAKTLLAIREMQTRNNRVRSEMVRARNEDLQAQIDERIKQIEELDKSEQSLRNMVGTLLGPNGTAYVESLLNRALADDKDYQDRMKEVQKEIDIQKERVKNSPIAKQIAEEEEKYANILAEGVRLDEELIAVDEELKGAQESLEEQEKISAEYFAGFQNVIDEINAAIAAAEAKVSSGSTGSNASSPPKEITKPKSTSKQAKAVPKPDEQPKMKKIKTPSTVAAPKSKRTSFPLLHKMTVPSSQTDLKKLGILTEKADIDDANELAQSQVDKSNVSGKSPSTSGRIRVKTPSQLQERAESQLSTEPADSEHSEPQAKPSVSNKSELNYKGNRFGSVSSGGSKENKTDNCLPVEQSITVKTEPMMQKDSNVKEPFNPVTEPNANMVTRMVKPPSVHQHDNKDGRRKSGVEKMFKQPVMPDRPGPSALRPQSPASNVKKPEFLEPKSVLDGANSKVAIDKSAPKKQKAVAPVAPLSIASSMRAPSFDTLSSISGLDFSVNNDQFNDDQFNDNVSMSDFGYNNQRRPRQPSEAGTTRSKNSDNLENRAAKSDFDFDWGNDGEDSTWNPEDNFGDFDMEEEAAGFDMDMSDDKQSVSSKDTKKQI